MNAKLANVFEHIAANEQTFIDRLMAYVRHPSISAHNMGIREVGNMLVAMLNDMGMNGRAIETAGHPMILGRRNDAPGKPTVLLYGHYDVQPPDPLDQWHSPPFEPTIRNGRIYARGIGDNKGQHFAQLMALESWLKVHGSLPCNVIVLLEGEEEIGSPRIAEFVRQHRDLLKCDLSITADGPVHESGRWSLEFGVRGIVSFEIKAKGADHDLHSGNFGGVVPNPIWALVHLLSTMKDQNGRITIDGIYDDVLPPGAPEQAAMANLPQDHDHLLKELKISQLDAPLERPFYERTMFYPTLTINGITGGYTGPGSKTVLPSTASVKCDMRLVKNMSIDDAFAKIEAHVKKHASLAACGCEVQFIRQGGMEPSRTPIDSPFTAPLVQAMTLAQGETPLLVPSVGGSLPDYVFTKILGVPAFVTPYANADEANHAPNENMEIWRFITGIKTGAAVLATLGGQLEN